MNRYRMEKRIKTPISAFESYDFEGYHIEPLIEREVSSPLKPELLISREWESENGNIAMIEFLTDLEPIVNGLSVLTQTIVFPLPTGSHLLYRLTNNDERLFYAHIATDSKVNGISLFPDTFEDLKKINAIENSVALSYLREAIGSLTSVQKLSALIGCAEAFAGSVKIVGHCDGCGKEYSHSGTDKDKLKIVLGDDLYKKLYTDGLRHKIMHGGSFEGELAADVANNLYTQITLGYIKNTFDLNYMREIVNGPRSFIFISSRHGGKMIDNIEPNLRLIESEWDEPKSFYFNALPDDY